MSVIDDINKKRKTLLKDVKGEPIGVIRTGYNENRNLAREYGEETFYKPGKTYLISTEGGDTAKGWKADMAENREKKDKLFKKSGSDVAVYGVKVAEDDRRLPESIAYRDFDSTMPKKPQTPVAQPTPAVKKEAPATPTPAVKEEVPATAPTPAAVATEAASQKEETPAAQSRYDKAIAYINEASKSPSWRERRDIRKMENAAKKEGPIEDGKKRIETEPIAFERDLEEVEIVADKNPTPQTPAVKEETPAEQAPAEQPAATTTQQEAAKDEVTVQPANTAQQTASEETPEPTTYTELLKRFYPVMTPEEKAEQQRRQRNRQIINAVGDGISALANLYYTNKSGVNAYDPSTSLTKAAKERYDKLLAQQREDEEKYKELAYRSGVADIEMAYRRAKDAAAEKRAEAEAKQKQENWEKLFNYNKEKDEREFNQAVAKAAADNATRRYIATLNAKVKQDYNNNLAKYKGEQATAKTLGKALPFPTDGEPLVIYENVWNTSAPEVMAILKEEGVETPLDWYMRQPTSTQIADWVKEHWRKSPRATALMRALAQITPTTLPVQAADDGVIDYVPGGAEEEIIDYVPNN